MSIVSRLKGAVQGFRGSSSTIPSDPAVAYDQALRAFKINFPAFYNQWLGGQADWARNVVSPALWGVLPGATKDFALEANQLWLNSTLSTCLSWIIDRFCEANLIVHAKGDRDKSPIENHPALLALETPNEGYDQNVLFSATCLSIVLEGNGYWYKERSGAGKLLQTWWLPHWSVRPRWPMDGSRFIDFYEYMVAGRFYRLEKSDVVHFRSGLDPENQRIGRSRLKALLRTIVADNEGEGWDAAIMKNMGMCPITFSPKDNTRMISKDDGDNFIDQWQAGHNGDNRGRPGFISRAVDVNKLGYSPKEAMMMEGRTAIQARLCAAIGLNTQAVGLPDNERTYDNYKTAMAAAYSGGVDPLHTLIARTLSRDADYVNTQTEMVGWDFAHIPARQEDMNAKSERVALLWQQDLLRHGESRAELGYEVAPESKDKYYSEFQAESKAKEDAANMDENDDINKGENE